MCCDGPCMRAFHLSCLGMDDVPGEEEWCCGSCQRLKDEEVKKKEKREINKIKKQKQQQRQKSGSR